MTIKQIQKIRYFLEKLNNVSHYLSMEEYVAELKGYFSNDFELNLKIRVFNTADSYKFEYLKQDKNSIRNYLERKLDEMPNVSRVIEILQLIEEGEKSKTNKTKMERFISKAYHSYSGIINFDSVVKNIATQNSVPQLDINFYTVNAAVVEGVIAKLKYYVDTFCNEPKKEELKSTAQTININTSANSNSSVAVVNIDLAIVQAKQQAEDEGLSDEQFRMVMEKLNELEKIGKSKESKGKKWQKAKEIMKWLVEQGIQVAGIIVPVIASCIK